ncbi:MAG: hypothetical protein OXU40_04295 [Nitrospira sp.]|nr:hypothetical protein [Nitrospira sp.]
MFHVPGNLHMVKYMQGRIHGTVWASIVGLAALFHLPPPVIPANAGIHLVGVSFAETRPAEDFIRAAAQNRADDVAAALKTEESGSFKDYQEEDTGLSAWHYAALFCSVEMALSLREAGANPNLISKEFLPVLPPPSFLRTQESRGDRGGQGHALVPSEDDARPVNALRPFQVLMMSIEESKQADPVHNFEDCQQVAQIMTGREQVGCLDRKCVDFESNTVLLGDETFAFGSGETTAALAPQETEDRVFSDPKGEINVSGNYTDGINNIVNSVINGKFSTQVGQKLTLETDGELIYRLVDQEVTRRRFNVNLYERYPVDRFGDEYKIDTMVYARQGYTTDRLGGFDRQIDVVLGASLDYDQEARFFGKLASALGGEHVLLEGGESSLNGQIELEGLLGVRFVKDIAWVNKAHLKDSTLLSGSFPSRTIELSTYVERPLIEMFKINTGYTYRLIDVDGDASVINMWGVGVAVVF